MEKAKFIKKIGIEFEGGWQESPDGLKADGSVSGIEAPFEGEVASPVLAPQAWLAWAQRLYPDEVNTSCGLHVHVSFKNTRSYSRLMDPDFYAKFLAFWHEWGTRRSINEGSAFWKRLSGENSYCKNLFRPDEQARQRTKGPERYCHINFCYGLHKTVEFRLLPMFHKKHLAMDAITSLLDFIEAYLAEEAKKHPKNEIISDESVFVDDTTLEYYVYEDLVGE